MTTIQASIPDYLAKLARETAEREHTTVDHIISIALSSQVSAWQVRDTVENRAQRGRGEELDAILAAVPDRQPMKGDEK